MITRGSFRLLRLQLALIFGLLCVAAGSAGPRMPRSCSVARAVQRETSQHNTQRLPLPVSVRWSHRDLYTKAGEVANLRQRLAGFEKDLEKLRDEKHALMLQASNSRGAAAGAPSREAARVKEMEKEIAQFRSKLEFRENETHKMNRCLSSPVLRVQCARTRSSRHPTSISRQFHAG